MFDTDITRRFTASALGVMLARVLALVSVFGLNVILARSLSPDDFGIFILFFSLTGLASLVACAGSNRSIVVKIAKDREISRGRAYSILRYGLRVAVAGGCIVGTVAGVVTYFLLPESATGSASQRGVLFGAIILVRTVHLVLAESARSFHDPLWSNLFGGPAGGPIPHLLFVGLLLLPGDWNQGSLITVLTLYLVAFVVTLPLLASKVFGLPNKRITPTATGQAGHLDKRVADDLLVLGFPLMLTQSCGLAMSQADIWIAGAMAAPALVATYGVAQRMLALLTIPLQIAGTAIVNLVPDLAARKNKAALQSMVGLAANVGGLPGIILSLIFLIFAEQILTIVFGVHYAQGANILRILVLGQIVCLLTGPCELLLMMAGQQNTALRVNVCAAIALGVLGPLAILGFGMTGLAAAIATVTASQNLANCLLAQSLLGVSTHVNFPWIRHRLQPTLKQRTP